MAGIFEGAAAVSPLSAGTPTVEHFPPEAFGGAHVFNGVVQAENGRIFVVAEHRLMAGTGDRWQAVPGLPDDDINYIHLTADQNLYLSLEHEFGFVALGETVLSEWHSISKDLPSEWSRGNDWRPLYEDAQGYVFFRAGAHVCAHHPEKPIRMWKDVGKVEHISSLHGEIHALTANREIYRLEANGNTEIVMRDLPPNYADIRASIPFDEDHQLFGTGFGGLVTFDGSGFQPFELKGIDPSHFVPDQLLALENELFLALDYSHGLLVFRHDGTVVRQVHQFGDLKARIAQAVTIDRDGWIWLAHTSGLYRINPNSPETAFDYHEGLEGRVLCMSEHAGKFYVGTEDGLFVWVETHELFAGHFEPMVDIPPTYSLVSTPKGLAIGTHRGLWIIDGRGPYLADDGAHPLLLQSQVAPQLLLAPTEQGIRVYKHNGNRWVPDPNAPKLPTSGLATGIGPHGELWGEYGPGRVLRYAFDPSRSEPTVYTPKEGLPLLRIEPIVVGDEMLFRSSDAVFRFSTERARFSHSDGWEWREHKRGEIPGARNFLSPDHALWVASSSLGQEYVKFPPEEFAYAWPNILRFAEDPISAIYLDSIHYLWIGNGRGLQRFRPHPAPLRPTYPRQTLIHRVETGGQGPMLVDDPIGVSDLDLGAFQGSQRLIRFEFSLLDFDHPGGTRFTTFLEGFDSDWQPYVPEPIRTVTALPPGAYTLHIKARNRYGEEGQPATVHFSIPTPLLETWWAKILYIAGAASLVGILVSLKLRQHVSTAKRLREELAAKENRVNTQIKELQESQAQLKMAREQSNEFSVMVEELTQDRAKFEVNLSHSLRPAVTSITHLGRLLAKESLGETGKRFLEGIREAGEFLVGSIRERLDLRELPATDFPIEKSDFDLREPIENGFAALAAPAKAKGIELNYSIEAGIPLQRVGDPVRVQQVISHLLANAIAFTHEDEVTIRVQKGQGNKADLLEFVIVDRGAGIDEEALEDLLAQTDPDFQPNYRGASQGMAIARHLLKALGGNLSIESIAGNGTRVKVMFVLPPAAISKPLISKHFAEKRVLIIDDNPSTLNCLQQLAEERGLHTRLANDGPQALEAIKEEPPADILWIDDGLGESRGHEVLTQIRENDRWAKLPAIILAPHTLDPELMVHGEDIHTIILSKPFHHGSLIAATEALLPLEIPEVVDEKYAHIAEIEEGDEDEADPSEDSLDAKIAAALAKSKGTAVDPEFVGSIVTEASSPLRILIVDTHPARPKVMVSLLNHFGYYAEIAADLFAAIEALEASDRDLVIISNPLADTPLAQVVGQLKGAIPDDSMPVFVAAGAELDEESSRSEIDEHLRTPIEPEALSRLLRLIRPVKKSD